MPDHWQETTLGEAADVVSGGTPRTAEPDFWNGEIVWVTPTEVVANEGRVISDSERKITPEGLAGSSAKMLPVDAVLLTSRATIGAVALAGVPLSTNQGFASLVCGDDLTPRFAMYWCQANTNEFLSRAGGNTFLEISRKKVAAIPVLLPPLDEQRRIVDLVGSIDAYIDSLETQIETTRTARSAVLSELLSNPGDDWEKCQLIDVCEVYQPKTISKAEMHDDGEYVVYGANGPIGRFSEFNHDQPEVVVTCRGATCGTLNMTPPKVWITGNAMVVSPKDARLSKEFLFSALQVAHLDQFISGSAQPQITRSTLGQLILPIPDSSRQGEISELVGSFDEQVSALESQVESVRALRSGVLSELLSGERLLDESYDVAVGL